MHIWETIRTALLTVAIMSSAFLAPMATSAQDATIETSHDYSNLEFVNPSAVTDPTATPLAIATPDTGSPSHGALLGSQDAPVTLQIYADYLCPHCRIFHLDIEQRLIEDYVQSGKIRLEFIDFPVIGLKTLDDLTDDSIESVQAAEAAMCAAEQGAYLPYRDALYSGDIAPERETLSDERLVEIAGALNLDSDALADCLQSGRYEQAIVNGSLAGLDIGVRGTPTMAVNGEIIPFTEEGYEGLVTTLDALIADTR